MSVMKGDSYQLIWMLFIRTTVHQADPSLNLRHGTDKMGMGTAHNRLKARRVSPTMKKR